MSNFAEFNKQFPNSKYKKIYKQYKLPTNPSKEDKEKYGAAKAPINTELYDYEDIKDYDGRIGWVVPNDYIVIDIDNIANSTIVYDILQSENVRFGCLTSKNGGHFIFKNPDEVNQTVKKFTAIGIEIDVRSMSKGYIVLPHNDTDRKWINVDSNVDDLPFYLAPINKLKVDKDFSVLGQGDGRNQAMFVHTKNLVDYAIELDQDQIKDAVRLINKYILEDSLSNKEIETILREDVFEKEEKTTKVRGVNLEEIARRILKDKRIITVNDKLYMYNGKYYKSLMDEELERIIHDEYDKNLIETNRKEVIKFIKLKTYVRPDEINKHWDEITCKNGILNMRTMKLESHTPDKLNTIYINYNFPPDIKYDYYSKTMDNFLNEVSGMELNKRQLLLEVVGASLLQRNPFSKLFLIVGTGSTGKSTFLDILHRLIGDEYSTNLDLRDFDHEFKPAELFTKLVNLGDDLSFNSRLEETGILKKLVTGQTIMARYIYGRPFNFRNFATIIFTSNKIPIFGDKTDGLRRRLCIITMNNKIKNPDPLFLEKLTDVDIEYLFYKAVEAIRDAMKRGYQLTETRESRTNMIEFQKDQSSAVRFLSDEFEYVNQINGMESSRLYELYKAWCDREGFRPLNASNFKADILDNWINIEYKNTTFNGEPQKRRYIVNE